jgi:hypothetical protein
MMPFVCHTVLVSVKNVMRSMDGAGTPALGRARAQRLGTSDLQVLTQPRFPAGCTGGTGGLTSAWLTRATELSRRPNHVSTLATPGTITRREHLAQADRRERSALAGNDHDRIAAHESGRDDTDQPEDSTPAVR